MPKSSSEYSLGYAIGKTNWYMKTLLNKLLREDKCGITNEQWFVLKMINENPGSSQTEIAEKSQKDKTNITRILDILENNAYVERRRDDRDRRMYRIHLTAEGKKVLKAVIPVTQKTEEICTHSLNKKQITEIIKLLDSVCANIKQEL
jgi:MarR family transcriptional regulator, organic hydroperoxide resistance regulator